MTPETRAQVIELARSEAEKDHAASGLRSEPHSSAYADFAIEYPGDGDAEELLCLAYRHRMAQLWEAETAKELGIEPKADSSESIKTLRDEIAIEALKRDRREYYSETIARDAYALADVMLKVRRES